jgi:hypothetical protein
LSLIISVFIIDLSSPLPSSKGPKDKAIRPAVKVELLNNLDSLGWRFGIMEEEEGLNWLEKKEKQEGDKTRGWGFSFFL